MADATPAETFFDLRCITDCAGSDAIQAFAQALGRIIVPYTSIIEQFRSTSTAQKLVPVLPSALRAERLLMRGSGAALNNPTDGRGDLLLAPFYNLPWS